jgi:hypothetical protein
MSFIFIRIDFIFWITGRRAVSFLPETWKDRSHTHVHGAHAPAMMDEKMKPSVIVEPATPILPFSDWCNPVT